MKNTFQLYDLRVELIRFESWKKATYWAEVWDYFTVEWENIFIPEWKWFSFYNLASIIPLLAVKQRVNNDNNDWIEIDDEIRAPDANCGAIFKIIRTWKRIFTSEDTSWNPKIHEK